MKKHLKLSVVLTFFGLGFLAVALGFLLGSKNQPRQDFRIPPLKPLEKYAIESLSKTEFKPGIFTIEAPLDENTSYTSFLFRFTFQPDPQSNFSKATSGQINLPEKEGKLPLVLMLRGYVDKDLYQTGVGTRKAADVLASEGFITLAPDFLGYAGSDTEAEAIFEARFQTYTSVLSLFKSLNQIEQWDGENVFIWAHSNGGQIALTVLEITANDIPATLWAPVSKPFPYSILYYTDESEDRGKYIRSELSKFEDLYDVDQFSIHSYFDRLNSPLQIHQGTADDAVPLEWNDELTKILENLGKEVTYFQYPNADHNLIPFWDLVVQRDLEFFNRHLKAR